jgi:archaellum biogenesis protein FlaJ (TadC family)
MERMPMWQIAIRRLEMPISRFVLVYVGGAFAMGLIGSLLLIFLTGGLAEGALFSGISGILLILVLPIIASLGAIAFPMLEVTRSANMIEREMHMFITRMGILSLGRSRCADYLRYPQANERLW